MVSFSCENCGDVVTRKKLDNHLHRCYNAPLTCIDCMTTFYGNQHKAHTSCISEAQKYEGALYRDKSKGRRSNPSSAPVTPGGYRQPSVEDAADSQTPPGNILARVDVPPPAPSPPPPNVFDFLVPDGRRSASISSRSSPAPPQITAPPPKKKVQLLEDAITYGNGHVHASNTKYPSELSLAMEVDASIGNQKPNAALHRTPAAHKYKTETHRPSDSKVNKSGSEKKRKRPPVEELDLSESRKSSQELSDTTPAVLHSGLTGGLAKMLAEKEGRSGQASPLSPKKRSRKEKYERFEKIETDSADGGRDRHRSKRREKRKDEEGHRRHKRHRSDGDDTVKQLEAPVELKRIEYHKYTNGAPTTTKSTITTSSSRSSFRSHSEFFISLVDKGHGSHKGQSIWGTLKNFHDGVCDGDRPDEYEHSGMRVLEEKKLLKALRMKVNSRGEVVLFARPDFEVDEEALGRRIEAP